MDLNATPTAPSQANLGAVVFPKTAAKKSPSVASVKAPISRLISAPKPKVGTGSKRTRKPRESKAKKPPQPDGYLWRKDGAGWELRKTIYVDDGTGSKVRKRPYVARMARDVFAEMKKRHKGQALEKAIQEWIAEHDR